MNEISSKQRRYLILGFPRSGTTLLSRLLDAHPEISCPPETYLFSSSARFLSEQAAVEGPPIGVLSGLSFLGVEPEEVMASLRAMVFGMHERIAGGAPVWVEKTAVDVFHLETLEEFLAGHVRFIALTRNPLDVVASNMDLADAMGAQLADLYGLTRGMNGPHEAIARAWIDRMTALDAFVARNEADCHSLRYEDLVADPANVLEELLRFMGLDGGGEELVATAFKTKPRIGLGDFRVNETSGVRPHDPNAWRKRLPRAAASRIVPLVAPLMEAHGYKVPKMPRLPTREDAVRQFVMAAQLKRGGETKA